ncbi:GCN5-related N-acetyltransferase [Janibacter hoylei PVAS-1]|uniref:GCN5-related N-acetyltransferase n=1 Tax=Janibacter hoylei PVAS-1 TaxID=1210046 RepID=K1E1G8_9MICO|nr:GNAT family N-acetyltransferase [Janibacter hoylei]EKA62549.1 GCN5-related N-acetyltransferase [Janibacter hoylei PVAS-1]RWU84706.1 GNAT family N-acetyltransferase [Janibacter hoylei PVAS-1]
MAQIVRPDARYQRSYLEALDEFDGAHRDGDGDLQLATDPTTGFAGLDFTREGLEDPDTFRRLVQARRADELPETPRPAHFVPCTYLWIAEGDTYLGSISFRHELTDFLLEQGGHIGYSVRPSARRQGHASTALRQVLELAAEMGHERVLITCDEDNAASRATIEGAGGVYEDSRVGKRRYWVPTVTTDRPAGALIG